MSVKILSPCKVDLIRPERLTADMTIPAGFGEAAFEFQGAAQPLGAVVTIGFSNDATQSATDCAQDLHTLMRDVVAAMCSVETSLLRTNVKLGPDATGPIGTYATTQAGGRSGDSCPPNVAFLVRKATALGGRQGRGRFYLPGIAEGDVDEGGTLSASIRDAASAALGTFHFAASAADVPPFLLHNDSLAPTAITTYNLDVKVATQRRRLRR